MSSSCCKMTDESSRYHRRRRSPSSYSHRPPPRCSRLGRSRGAPQSYHRRRSHVVSDGSIRRSRLCIQSKMCTWSGRLPFHSVSIRLVGLKLSSIRGNSIILLCDRQRHGETWSSVITTSTLLHPFPHFSHSDELAKSSISLS